MSVTNTRLNTATTDNNAWLAYVIDGSWYMIFHESYMI